MIVDWIPTCIAGLILVENELLTNLYGMPCRPYLQHSKTRSCGRIRVAIFTRFFIRSYGELRAVTDSLEME